MRINVRQSKHITVTGIWLKIEEAPEPISVPIRTQSMRKGDTLEIMMTFDELIDSFGTRDIDEPPQGMTSEGVRSR